MNTNTLNIPCNHEKAGNIFPIVFCTNDKYAPYAGAAIQSIISNANPHNLYPIYVLHTSISAEHIEALESMSTENITVRCLNIGYLMDRIQTTLPTSDDFTEEAYYRILIPEIEALRSYPFVIYLDCDVIVDSDIAGIIPQNMANNLIAAVRDHPMKRKADSLRLERDFKLDAAQYINSGVLVVNVPQWIQEKTSKECFDFLRNISPTKRIYFDQDIINIVCKNRIVYLDESWNYNWFLRYGDRETVELCKPIADKIGADFHILHFTTPFKPWCTLDHPYSHYFWKYAGQSPFLEEIIKTNLCSKAELKNELPYIRIGRTITFLPRKLYGSIKCFRDHGVGYTLRRTLYHIGLWKDEEAPLGPENRAKLVKYAERILQPKK